MLPRSDPAKQALAERVIAEATEIASEEGLRGITMRRIAERIGHPPAGLYEVFGGDIDDVILRVGEATFIALAGRLAACEAAAGDATPQERAMLLAEALFDHVAERRLLWSVLFQHTLLPGRGHPQWYRMARDRPIEVLSRALAPLFPDNPATLRVTVETLWAALLGIAALGVGGALTPVIHPHPQRRMIRLLVGRYLTGADPH
jgi:AcrR family transcriptional regulator